MKRLSLAGQKFGRLVVLRDTGETVDGMSIWLCRCDCGTEVRAKGPALRYGRVRSCGCLKGDLIRARPPRHGDARPASPAPEWRSWRAMMRRCYERGHGAFERYGRRGIIVCERWHVYENFRADMGPKPSPTHTLDRYPNNGGNYEPGNVRWATPREQMRNRRNNVLLTYNGRTLAIFEWAEELGVSARILDQRARRGWSTERVLTEPIHAEKQRTR